MGKESDADDAPFSSAFSTSSTSRRHIVGTCDLMCPVAERALRERKGELDVFERVDEDDRGTSSPALAVKKYTRIVDDPSPAAVRTKKALQNTTEHLYSLLGGKADYSEDAGEASLLSRSNFLWDRLRGVRQDMTLQALSDTWAVTRLEEMCRFGVAAEYLLCPDAATSEHPGGHNSHLHVEQLAKTLTSLTHLYNDLRRPEGKECAGDLKGGGEDELHRKLQFPHEPEMVCYQLLLRLDTHGPFRRCEGSEFLRDLRGLRPEVLESPQVKLALAARREYTADNAAGFFRLARSKRCSFLQACCLHKYFAKVRVKALEVINKTHNKSPLPMGVVGKGEGLGGSKEETV